jgi:hypothetical protein
MKKASSRRAGSDIRPEYDFASLSGGVRGKYAARYRAGVNLALLEPEVAKAFPSDRAVNEALRTIMRASKPHKRPKQLPNKRMQLTRSAKANGRRGPRS